MKSPPSDPYYHCPSNACSKQVVDTNFQPNKTPVELQAMMHDGGGDPLRDFSDVCRNELGTDLLA
jgi:hypothetical protein